MSGQPDFAAAVLDPGRAAPAGLTAPGGRMAGKRFDVYRNNVAVGLIEALETGFPAVRRLVGEDFFAAIAGVFARRHPPTSPVLPLYGEGFPGFVEAFPPAAGLAYLGDVARLELAMRQAYHAADPAVFDPARLAAVPPERVETLRLDLAPAVRLVRSRHPVHAIWQAATSPDRTRPPARAEDVLICRPGLDPTADPLPPGAADCIAALLQGRPLGCAASAGAGAEQGFDLGNLLGLLLSRAAIADFNESP